MASGLWGRIGARRATHTNFSIGHHNKAAAPSLDVFGLEDCLNSLDKSPAAGVSQAYNHQSLVSPQLKPTDIRKVEVLRDEESPGFL